MENVPHTGVFRCLWGKEEKRGDEIKATQLRSEVGRESVHVCMCVSVNVCLRVCACVRV